MRPLIALARGAIAAALFVSSAGAIEYHSGDVWGVWARADSPHIIIADVRVPPGQSLTIEPGCQVLFRGYYKFVVDSAAVLHAVGTETDSILFDAETPGVYWHGIRFLKARSASIISYARLQHGWAQGALPDNNGGALFCYQTNPTVSHCALDSNRADHNGGAISLSQASPHLVDNSLTANSCGNNGGALCGADSSNLEMRGNFFRANQADSNGGAVYLYGSSPLVTGNSFVGNRALGEESMGGAFCCLHGIPTISNNEFTGNAAVRWGGAVYLGWSPCAVDSNAFIGNKVTGSNRQGGGGGLSCESSDAVIRGNTFLADSVMDLALEGGGLHAVRSNALITENVFALNYAGGWGGGVIVWGYYPVLSRNVFTGNYGGSGGGAECVGDSILGKVSVVENLFQGNSAFNGGGLECDAIGMTAEDNLFLQNWADQGGGFSFGDIIGAKPKLVRCVFVGNEARGCGYGGAMYGNSATVELINCTVTLNRADNRGGGLCGWSVTKNTIFWGNSAPLWPEICGSNQEVTYSDIAGGWPGTGNIDEDPLFVGAPDSVQLQEGSPCIDAGDPTSPRDPDQTRADVGAYYFDQRPRPRNPLGPPGALRKSDPTGPLPEK
jgi:hypothetical protein